MNYIERCEFLCNGQEAINLAKQIFNDALQANETKNMSRIRPISLMLLDFQMPIKTGIDVVREIRQFLKIKNGNLDSLTIQEPEFIILSSYNTAGFKNHLK